MIIWLTLGLTVAVVRREPALVPTQLVGLAGTAWVVGLSLWHPLRARAAAGGPAVAGLHHAHVTHRPRSSPHDQHTAAAMLDQKLFVEDVLTIRFPISMSDGGTASR